MKAAVSYKKQDGSLEYDESARVLRWSPLSGPPSVNIDLATINNLKQTPAASEKVVLKVELAAASHNFTFTSPTRARAEQEVVTDTLRNAITALRSGAGTALSAQPATPANENGEAQSAAMAIAHAVKSNAKATNSWSDDKRLISNIELQESLFEKDAELRQRFQQSLAEKPESISLSQFGTQFWSSRLALLRSHAIEKSQIQGAYNVLAQLKETNVDGTRKLSLTREQIQALWSQHPIILHIYNEVVPARLSEAEFWTRFFGSRLLRKLKGERIRDDQSRDAVIDKYLDQTEQSMRDKQLSEARIPHFIDLEGNEQNHSQKQGNRPHYSMIPAFSGKVPILNVLNNMSERMMSNVAPKDGPAHAPIGMDESTYNELRLRDLQADEGEDRVVLNIRGQRRLLGHQGHDNAEDDGESASQDPRKVLNAIRKDVGGPISLDIDPNTNPSDTSAALDQMVAMINQQRELTSSQARESTLSPASFQALILTQNTAMEFLHYFWTVFLASSSGATAAARKDLASLHLTLGKSIDRIQAVAEGAEKERLGKINELKRAAREYFEKTGKKRRIDESEVTIGGRSEVETIMTPTIKAIEVARARYQASAEVL